MDGLLSEIDDKDNIKLGECKIIMKSLAAVYVVVNYTVALSVVICFSAENPEPAESGGTVAETVVRPSDITTGHCNP